MSLLVSVLASCLSLALGDPLAFADEVAVASPVVRLGDVADLSPLPIALRARAADLIVADLGTETVVTVSDRRLAEQARRQLPGLGPWLAAHGDHTVQLRLESSPRAVEASVRAPVACARMARDVERGAVVSAADLAPASCAESPRSAFSYDDTTGALRSVRDLRSGEAVARPPAFALAAIAPGQTVTIRASIGPVVVERDVVALQSARTGQNLFVRSADGQVFTVAAPLSSEAAQ